MDSKPKPVYEDFKVHTEWSGDTLIANLPGFTREQLKVLITSGGNLRISGERPIGGNKFSRFLEEIEIPSNCDLNKISAALKGGMLSIKCPKLIVAKPSAGVPTTVDQNAAAGQQPPSPSTSPPADVPRKQSNGGPEQAVQEAPPPMGAAMEKQRGDEKKTDGLAKEADNVADDKAATLKEAPPMADTTEKQTGEKTNGLAKVADSVSDKAAPDKEGPPMAAMEKQTSDEKKDGLAAAKEAVYEDFKVHTEWSGDNLIANIPGFTREKLKVQITSGGNLRISGERPTGGNKFSRFLEEIEIPSNCDLNKISATFKGGMLSIKCPKLIVAKPSAEVPTTFDQNAAAGQQPPRPSTSPPADVPRKQSNGGPEQAVQEAPPPMGAAMEKHSGDEKKTDGLAKEADNVADDKAQHLKKLLPWRAPRKNKQARRQMG